MGLSYVHGEWKISFLHCMMRECKKCSIITTARGSIMICSKWKDFSCHQVQKSSYSFSPIVVNYNFIAFNTLYTWTILGKKYSRETYWLAMWEYVIRSRQQRKGWICHPEDNGKRKNEKVQMETLRVLLFFSHNFYFHRLLAIGKQWLMNTSERNQWDVNRGGLYVWVYLRYAFVYVNMLIDERRKVWLWRPSIRWMRWKLEIICSKITANDGMYSQNIFPWNILMLVYI